MFSGLYLDDISANLFLINEPDTERLSCTNKDLHTTGGGIIQGELFGGFRYTHGSRTNCVYVKVRTNLLPDPLFLSLLTIRLPL